MPRPKTRRPKYRHYKPKDLAVVRLNDRDFYLGKYESSESHELYHRLIAEWLANGRNLPPSFELADLSGGTLRDQPSSPRLKSGPNGNGPTVNELILDYWKHVETYYLKNGRPTSEVDNIRQALRPLRRLYGHTVANEFGPMALKTVRQAMVDADRSRKLINKDVNRIRGMFRWAVENELVPPAVHQALATVAGLRKGRTDARETGPVTPVPEVYVEAVAPYVARQVWAMIELQRLSGMRPGEVTIMRTCDLDTSGPVWEYRPPSHKTEHHGHGKVCYLGPRCQEIIRTWLRTKLDEYLFQPEEAEAVRNTDRRRNRQSPMTPSQGARKPKPNRKRPPGDRYDTASYRRAIHYGCRKATKQNVKRYMQEHGFGKQPDPIPADLIIPEWSPHRLKHNAGTAIRKEYGAEVARVVLGHQQLSTTEIYAEQDRTKAIEAMRQLG